jgi:hypothetical protein
MSSEPMTAAVIVRAKAIWGPQPVGLHSAQRATAGVARDPVTWFMRRASRRIG